MSKNVMINTKGSVLLKEAIRIVAYNQGHNKSAKTMRDILEADPLISKELKKLQHGCKNKVK